MWQWCVLGAASAALVLAGIRLKLHKSWGRAVPGDPKSLRGRTVIITGATSGLGLIATRLLVARGARIILGCRDVAKGREVVKQIRQKQPHGGELIVMELDLGSFDSIKAFADLVKVACTKIDILINNAGVYLPITMHEITKDGFEMHFGVNHLGHFLLTKLLLDLLKKNPSPSRVVIVSSLLHENGTIDFEDLNLSNIYKAVKSGDKQIIKKYKRHGPGYCNSKLMNVYFGRGLADRTKNTKIDVFSVCPGFTYTSLFRHAFRWYHFILMWPFLFFYMRTAEEGVQTIINCAVDPSLQGKSGTFYRNCVPYTSKINFNRDVQEKLWEVSEALIEPALTNKESQKDK